MTSAVDAIRARRKLTNKLIAAHQAARLAPFFAPDMTLNAGEGSLLVGSKGVIEAFEAQFADPAFIAYVRETQDVSLDEAGRRAAERGTWTALWRGAGGETRLGGDYLAAWRLQTGQWVIEYEAYVTLSGDA